MNKAIKSLLALAQKPLLLVETVFDKLYLAEKVPSPKYVSHSNWRKYLYEIGNKDGIEIDGKELVPWKDFYDLLRPINIATKNNLLVTLAACKSAWSWVSVPLSEECPVCAIIAPVEDVSVGEVEEEIQALEDLTERYVNFYLFGDTTVYQSSFLSRPKPPAS